MQMRYNNNLINGKTTRIQYLDIIKGLCIISIVLLHACQFLRSSTYYIIDFFYIAGFFFAAGVTYKRKSVREWIKSVFLRIYIPFVIANIIAIVVAPLLDKISCYSMSGADLRVRIFQVFLLNYAEGIVLPSWFILSYLLTAFLYLVLDKIISNKSCRLVLILIIFVLTAIFYDKLKNVIWSHHPFLVVTGVMLPVFALGDYYKVKEKEITEWAHKKIASAVCFVCIVFLLMVRNMTDFDLDLYQGTIIEGWWLPVVFLTGIYILIHVSKLIEKTAIGACLSLIGQKTLPIMFYHCMCFSMVSVLYKFITNKEYQTTWANNIDIFWLQIASVILGVCVPTIISTYVIGPIKPKRK